MCDVKVTHILIFLMPDTCQIVTPFIPLRSHIYVRNNNYDNDTFTVACFYDILQHLLRICMSTQAFVKFQEIFHPKFSKLSKYCRIVKLQRIYTYIHIISNVRKFVVSGAEAHGKSTNCENAVTISQISVKY